MLTTFHFTPLSQCSACDSSSYLLSSENDGHHTLRLCGLSGLVYQHRSESELGQSRVAGTNTCAADNVCMLQKFSLSATFQCAVALLVSWRQLAGFVLELLELGELGVGIQIADLDEEHREIETVSERVKSCTGHSKHNWAMSHPGNTRPLSKVLKQHLHSSLPSYPGPS